MLDLRMNVPIGILFVSVINCWIGKDAKLKPTEGCSLIQLPLRAVSALCGAMVSTVGQYASCLPKFQLTTV